MRTQSQINSAAAYYVAMASVVLVLSALTTHHLTMKHDTPWSTAAIPYVTAENLEGAVRAWLETIPLGERQQAFDDLAQHGTSSMIGGLADDTDAAQFFDTHEAEAWCHLAQVLDRQRTTMRAFLGYQGWDESDPFAKKENNQAILGRFAFQRAAITLEHSGDWED